MSKLPVSAPAAVDEAAVDALLAGWERERASYSSAKVLVRCPFNPAFSHTLRLCIGSAAGFQTMTLSLCCVWPCACRSWRQRTWPR
jgi:hypothetical protein